MEEKINSQQSEDTALVGLITIVGTLITGYMLGVVTTSRSVTRAYRNGVVDTLDNIVRR